MSDGYMYDESYFIHGKESGKSLYENYRWMPTLTIPMAGAIAQHCWLNPMDLNSAEPDKTGHTILDFGCARGYLVKALRMMKFRAFGVDVSEWAIKNADEETKPYLELMSSRPPFLHQEFDWIIAKDVLEHIPYVASKITDLMMTAKIGLFVVVPLVKFTGTPYVIAEYEKDVTHIQRRTLAQWTEMFVRPGWRVEVSYRLPGVKDNYYRPGWELGNGFITARRIEE